MWRLCDLHNHTTPNEQCDAVWDAEEFVRSCLAADLDVVAVTDHDHCNHVAEALAAAEATSLTVVPGVELSTDHGHMLALAPGEDGLETIASFCLRLGVVPNQQVKFDALVGAFDSKRDAQSLFSDQIVLIGAHVDAKSSLLSTESTLSIELQLDAARRLDALEVNSPERRAEWIAGGVKQSDEVFTLVQGSDTHDPTNRIRRSTWLFLPEVSVDHLRHSLALPESSVSVGEERPASPEWSIEFVEFDGGHHSGQRFELSERANAIIGPPNAGKSLIVDALKFAFGIQSDIDEVERITASRMAAALPKGSTVRVGVRTPNGPAVIERIVGGLDQPVIPFEPIVFSQTELTRRSIASTPAVQLLDIHCDNVGSAKTAISNAADNVAQLFSDLCESAGRTRQLREAVENPEDGLAATQASIQELSGQESVATDAMNIEKVSGWQIDAASSVQRWFDALTVEPMDVPITPVLADSAADLTALTPAGALRDAMEMAHQELTDSLRRGRQEVDAVLAPAIDLLAAQRDATDSELEQHGFQKGSELLESVRRLQSRLGRLERDKSELDSLESRITEGLVDLRRALAGVEKARSELSEVRKHGCSRVNASMHSFFAKVDNTGLTKNMEHLFDELATGTKLHSSTRQRALESLDRMRFMELAIREIQGRPLSPSDKFAEQDRVVAEALDRAKQDQIPQLACCYPGDSLDLMWKAEKPPRSFEGLTEGLRALAIKEISFAASELPVISDQPEDAVPTRSVFTSLVPTLREQRKLRQFLVISHDANIVVTSDVDRIVVLEANDDGTHAHGSLFDPQIQAAALEHLEGGRRAFMLRSDRYGKSNP